ncbi:MAG: GGDEF domain-containing protein [Candidatus Brocadiia bacterium]
MKPIIEHLRKQSRLFRILVGYSLVVVLWALDYWTTADISFLIFYMVPIFVVTWFVNRAQGIIISGISIIAWLTADTMSMPAHSRFVAPTVDLMVEFGFFIMAVLFLSMLRTAFNRERQQSRTDSLTGVANHRYFQEVALDEIERANRSRYPLTVAYFDIDNFKNVNDRLGHSAGDNLLRTVAQSTASAIRKVDTVARMGGDEFVILMPATDYDQAQVVMNRVYENLTDTARSNKWPVGFSIGVATCLNPPCSVDVMLRLADNLMYDVKNNGKNRIKHELITE